MYTEREEQLFQHNAPKCPSRTPGHDSTLPGCTLGKQGGQECIGATSCPVFYWLKVTGLLNAATYPMQLYPGSGGEQVRRSG